MRLDEIFLYFSSGRRSHSAFKFLFLFSFERMNMKVDLNSVIIIVVAVFILKCYVMYNVCTANSYMKFMHVSSLILQPELKLFC